MWFDPLGFIDVDVPFKTEESIDTIPCEKLEHLFSCGFLTGLSACYDFSSVDAYILKW